MTLYLVSTCGLGDFHVLANSFDAAVDCLIRILNDSNYGFMENRRVVNVKVITSAIKPIGYGTEKGKPHLSDKFSRLLIVEDWIKEDKPK